MDLFEAHRANPDIFTQFSMKDALFLHYKCPQTDKILQLYSKHIQFGFTLSGQRYLQHGNQKWVANPKKGSLLKKCAFLQELPDDHAGWNVFTFYLKDEYLRSIFDEYRPHLSLEGLPDPNKEMIEEFEIDDQIRSCYESLIPYFGQKKPLPESILEGKFKELLFNIFSHPGNKHILAYVSKIADRYQTPIWEVMEENYLYDLKISDFANISGRSLAAFKRDFKDYYKTSPGRWLTERRLKRAKFLLETTEKTIKEIAFDCGFSNVSHFSRVFKEHFQKSPSQIFT
ncbi:MAG: helix-turn-helix transcriptional regulator [Bacteroidota bacterium]